MSLTETTRGASSSRHNALDAASDLGPLTSRLELCRIRYTRSGSATARGGGGSGAPRLISFNSAWIHSEVLVEEAWRCITD
jgi:hypothetical protein